MKANTTVGIDHELKAKAIKRKLNLSALLEQKIKEVIENEK